MGALDSEDHPQRIALVGRGNPDRAPRRHPMLEPMFAALEALGVTPVQVIYAEAAAERVRAQLLGCDGALVWVNPMADGVDRTLFDALLREVSAEGVWISAHPDVILKMGVKEVLTRTRTLGWGSDAHACDTVETFRREFPARLAANRVRVLKPNRGNGSQGVLKVEVTSPGALDADSRLTVVEARGDVTETGVRLADFMDRYDTYLSGGGGLIDQDLQPRVGEGLVRCYMCQDKVAGFSEQFPRSKGPGEPAGAPFGMASDKTMHEETAPRFQGLRRKMETEWTPGLQRLLDIETAALPVLWDADFFYGPKTPDGEDSFVLCEINVSCVIPFPPTAAPRVAAAARDRSAEFRGWRRSGSAP
ncbi:MAG TPA: Cj0069 family protein [Caulobacteraceae bacterium]|nr:Cj0069 family protein [Caulobacteraceae bacterium]